MTGAPDAMSFASGRIAPDLQAEFPGLRLHWTALEARVRGSPRDVRARLRALSDRVAGAGVVAMRTKPIPHAYRAFFRQVGLDPDAARIPSEEAAVRRLLEGRFHSRDTLADALLIALVETGVPVWALDASVVDLASLGIRTADGGERLVVADAVRVHATLFGDPAPGHAAGPGTDRMVLYAVAVEGVPAIHVEEALWISTDILGAR
jgi:DNA/RNA-binding domain of Phe-tRNA-synthetase-like protein